MTNPIKDYIKAVEKKLPGDRRSLVAAELVVQLKAQREALEKTLGRKANEDDLEKLVAGLSPPEQAAERYGGPKGAYDLLERYLLSVQRKLPLGVPSHDILAELREALTTKIEAKLDAAGQVTSEDIAGVLKAFGSPDIVAYSYRSRPALIGPEVAPYFWTIQRVVLGIVFSIILLLAVLDGIGSPRPVTTVLRALGRIWEAGLFSFGAVTLVFILADAWAPRFRLDKLWSPRLLPDASVREPKSRFESLFALVFDAIFILWWIGSIGWPEMGRGPGSHFELELSGAWDPLKTPILALAILTGIVHLADLVHPGWSRLRAVVAIVGCLGGIAVVSLISRAGDLVVVSGVEVTPERAATVTYWITTVVRASLIVMALVWAIQAAVEVYRLARSRSRAAGVPKPA